jgi:hypothetical protein
VNQQQAGIRFGAVHIIDSVPHGEYPTGRRLYDVLRPHGYALQPYIETLYYREEARAGFLSRFPAILQHLRESHRAPIIHIEAHGLLDASERSVGFALASSETVTWGDLEPLLKQINVTCCLNLLVVAGACHGLGLAVILQAGDRAPVWGILGPTRTVTAGELDGGHHAFYQTLYAERDFTPAMEAMNASVPAGDEPFVLFGAQWFFKEVMRGYFERYRTEDSIVARVQKAAPKEEALRQHGVPEKEILRRREAFRRHLRDHRGHFDKMKPVFFAEDLCPENAKRFLISFEEVMPSSSGR